MSEEKIYVGSGKQVGNYDMVNISVCMTDAEPYITEYNGKKYLRLTVSKKKNTDQYGKTHSVCINTYNPNDTTNRVEIENPEIPNNDDLPFS